MPEKKKQHYVPKFYLKLFSGSSEKSINLYNINKCLNIKDANLKNQCYEPYFYGKNLVIENTFGTIETAVSGIINGINNSNLVPKYFSKQHHAILTYVLLQYARTKYSALAYDEFTDKFCKLIIEKDKKLSKEELDKVIISNKDPIGFQLKIMAQSIPLAMDLHVKVLSNKTKIDFITSDNPVVLYNQACERSTVGSNTGLASKGLQVFFPISPKKIIVFFDSKIYKIGKRKCSISSIVTETDVAQLNDLQWLNALENIYYGKNQSFSEIMRSNKKNVNKRHKEKSLLNKYASEPRKDGEESILLHMHKPDLKVGLNLQCIKQIRIISDAELYNGSKSVRDLEFIAIHNEFLELVEKGKYKVSDFPQYLKELS